MQTAPRPPLPRIGLAGRCGNDEEKAHVKQAMFLLRFRMRQFEGRRAGPMADDAAPS